MDLTDYIKCKREWIIEKFASDEDYAAGKSYERVVIDGNLLLNAGITLFLQLLGATAAPTAFSNAAARLGVGDSSTAEAATQTALQAATNKTYKAMAATYPQVSAQTISFQSVFGSADANYTWAEFTVDNGVTALNRKVSAQGTKASGQTWTLTLNLTFA